jgi:hypothetical protein
MIIEILVCTPEGAQVLQSQEVPDNYFDTDPDTSEPQS